jgi:hypothetical protein
MDRALWKHYVGHWSMQAFVDLHRAAGLGSLEAMVTEYVERIPDMLGFGPQELQTWGQGVREYVYRGLLACRGTEWK